MLISFISILDVVSFLAGFIFYSLGWIFITIYQNVSKTTGVSKMYTPEYKILTFSVQNITNIITIKNNVNIKED